ncbi:hypothetical protein ANN_26830 [Periplaneta americana]|uniref:Uncharacterized protein n=1 Tax=Periplaneta americana TaxID=6978 RepID=A0ABQ8RZ52_PERAM|nr:hypothetical protein ANN_26830 [Periplaneta americana]
MSPGSTTENYPAFAHIGLRENPGKNLNQITCPDRESNPGHLVSRSDAQTVTPQVWAQQNTFDVRGRCLCYVLFNDARNCRGYISVADVQEFCPAGVLLHASKSTVMSLSHLSTGIEAATSGIEGQRYTNCGNQVDSVEDILHRINCPKTGLNLTSDTKKAPLMKQVEQEIMV